MAEEAGRRPAPRGGRRAISRMLVLGFATIALVSALLSATLVAMVMRVEQSLADVREDARSAQSALTLAAEAREHYQHESHAIIHGAAADVEPHAEWVPRVRQRAAQLAGRVPSGEQWHLGRLGENLSELDQVFRDEVLPAAAARDHERLDVAHARASGITQAITADADAVALSLEKRMQKSQARAREAAELAATVGVGGVALVVLLASGFAVGLRRLILGPLRRLAEAADRIGRGESTVPAAVGGRGEIATVIEAFEEMSDRLRKRERELVESERMAVVGQLAAGVAHEINNPIAVIRGYLRTMMPEALGEELREELEILDDEAAACQRIVEDLLSFARAPHLQRSQVQARDLLESAAHRFAATAEGRGHPVEVHAEPASVSLDAVRMRQVLDNLLRNAAQASCDGEPIVVRGIARNGGYRIEVVDRGGGIEESDREAVFEPFRSSREGGTGLGLAVCKSIVDAHEGRIDVQPADGGGARFVVDLPWKPGPGT